MHVLLLLLGGPLPTLCLLLTLGATPRPLRAGPTFCGLGAVTYSPPPTAWPPVCCGWLLAPGRPRWTGSSVGTGSGSSVLLSLSLACGWPPGKMSGQESPVKCGAGMRGDQLLSLCRRSSRPLSHRMLLRLRQPEGGFCLPGQKHQDLGSCVPGHAAQHHKVRRGPILRRGGPRASPGSACMLSATWSPRGASPSLVPGLGGGWSWKGEGGRQLGAQHEPGSGTFVST